MKKTIITFFVLSIVLLISSSHILKFGNGNVAGYAGSPGEQTCSGGGNCHSGGSSSSKSVTITASPSFSMDQYYPDSIYTVSVTVMASTFSHFGFASEIINSSGVNTGTIQLPGQGVKLSTAFNGRRNATHNAVKVGAAQATFTFKWLAPSVGSSDAIFYVCANAVNGNGSTTGDLPIPYSYTLTEGVAPTATVNAIRDINTIISKVSVFPNPSEDFTTVTYALKETKTIHIELTDVSGKKIKELYNGIQYPGNHSEVLNFRGTSSGAYFVKILANEQKVSQKLIIIQ